MVAKLLKELKIADLRGYADHPSFYNSNGDTLLHRAAYHGFLDIVQFLLETKMPVNVINLGGGTPLIVACAKGHTQVAQYLLSNKANVNIFDNSSTRSALTYSVETKNIELVNLLLENGAIIKRKNALPLAMTHPKIIALLFRYGAAIGEDYPQTIAQLAPIIDASNCLLLGTKINNVPVASIKPAIFINAIFDGQTVPDTALGKATQETSILRCCKYALENYSLDSATRQTLTQLFTTRIKISGLRNLILHRLTVESFCQDVIKKSNIVVNVPQDLKEHMETFYSVLAKRNAATTIIEPISELPTHVTSREYLENLTRLEQEVLRFQDELRTTYNVYNKIGVTLVTATVILFCLIWLACIILLSRTKIDDKFLWGVVITIVAVFEGALSIGLLNCIGVTCVDDLVPVAKLPQHHHANVQALRHWIEQFPVLESTEDDQREIESSLQAWSYNKALIANSRYSIDDFYRIILSSVVDRIRKDRPLIHLQFAKYGQFFKPYAKTPSLFSEAREQVFEFDLESNRLEFNANPTANQ